MIQANVATTTPPAKGFSEILPGEKVKVVDVAEGRLYMFDDEFCWPNRQGNKYQSINETASDLFQN